MSGLAKVPVPHNEPVRSYAPGTAERAGLKAALEQMASVTLDVPMRLGKERVTTGELIPIVMPHEHRHVLGYGHAAGSQHVTQAINAALKAKSSWAALPWEERTAVFLKAADLLVGPYRDRMNAATMLGQSKTAHQAEIDAACELADFWRFNAAYYTQLMSDQPLSPPGQWNRLELRPLEGFVFAVTPFNFTSIAGNLPTAPALVGNTVVWKPAPTQLLSAQIIIEILDAAGLPPGVINVVTGQPGMIGEIALASPDLGGIHFTGSTAVFQHLWGQVGKSIASYRQYPRLVGETGGKDFIFAHPTADFEALATAIIRGGYEFQGQKCSAASRIYVPKSLWKPLEERLVAEIAQLRMGDVRDFTHFMGAVIDARAYQKISGYLELAKGSSDCKVLCGGVASDAKGWFIAPTLVETQDPMHRLMREEIFGPVVTVWVYPDNKIDEAVSLCDTSTPYGLTGAVFAQDRLAIDALTRRLSGAAGNFYVNDKPTGAVVGQQPFGGSRASGTNDKAGSVLNLLRWVSPRALKETFTPARDWRYPFLNEP